MPLRLLVFGRQGAGKGTQCALLSAHFGAPHISTGDMLREAAAEGTEFGLRAKEIMDRGELLPDEVMLGVIHDRLEHDDVRDNGFILDGFPRTVSQSESLVALTPIDLAVNIEVPEQVVLDRISGRRVCAQGHIYSADDEAARSGVCPVDGTAVVQRPDDTPASVTARLDAYATKTLLAVAWFDSKGLLCTVDGVGTTEQVTERLIDAIDERLQASRRG